jgi:hypothetical protein
MQHRLVIAALVMALAACSAQEQGPVGRVAEVIYAMAVREEPKTINGDLYAMVRNRDREKLEAELARVGLRADEDQSRLFVPVLEDYAGFFDRMYSLRAADEGRGMTYEHGRVRVFWPKELDWGFVMVLTERSSRIETALR